MLNQITLNSKGKEIKYEFRFNRILLMFTNFNDEQLNKLADMLEQGSEQIESVENVLTYEENIGAIIITMVNGYDETLANNDIKEIFEYEYNPQILPHG